MTHLTLPLKLKVRATSLWQGKDFSMKRVVLWALVFTDAFFVGVLIARTFSVIKM